jgi:hypothetical protein
MRIMKLEYPLTDLRLSIVLCNSDSLASEALLPAVALESKA